MPEGKHWRISVFGKIDTRFGPFLLSCNVRHLEVPILLDHPVNCLLLLNLKGKRQNVRGGEHLPPLRAARHTPPPLHLLHGAHGHHPGRGRLRGRLREGLHRLQRVARSRVRDRLEVRHPFSMTVVYSDSLPTLYTLRRPVMREVLSTIIWGVPPAGGPLL